MDEYENIYGEKFNEISLHKKKISVLTEIRYYWMMFLKTLEKCAGKFMS